MAVDNHGFRLTQSGDWTINGEVVLERDRGGWRARVDWRTRPTTKATLIEHGLVGRQDGLALGAVLRYEVLWSETFSSAREVCEAVASCLGCSSRRSRYRSYSVEGTRCRLFRHPISEVWRFGHVSEVSSRMDGGKYESDASPRRGPVSKYMMVQRLDARQERIFEEVRGRDYETRGEALADLRAVCDRAEPSMGLLPTGIRVRAEGLFRRRRDSRASRGGAADSEGRLSRS